MGPIHPTGNIWLPVEPPERSGRGDLELNEDKDRTARRLAERRRRRQSDPDADEFTHSSEQEDE